jgi:predicted AlkP superfamily phosphohydrolase/phosphomutase
MLLNAGIAGGIFAAYLAVLVLQLNPSIPLRPGTVGALVLPILLLHGSLVALVFYAALLVRHLLAETVLSPGWVSFQLLVWLCLIASGVAAALTWLNLSGLRVTLEDDAARRMALGAVVLTVGVAVLLGLGVFRFSFGRGGRAGPAAFGIVVFASFAVPLWLRGSPQETRDVARPDAGVSSFAAFPRGRVTMLLLDGASLDFISPAVADGGLPNVGRILEDGAVMHLATLRPTQPAPVLTAIATGKLPRRTGVRSAVLYRVRPAGPTLELLPDYCFAHGLVAAGLVEERAHTSASVRARPLWAILSSSGIATAVVRWPLTYPARSVPGDMVTDRLHALPAASPVAYPPELATRLRTIPETPDTASAAASLSAPGIQPYAGGAALALDRLYSGALDAVREDPEARLVAMRYVGLDTVGHDYLRQAMPRAFGDVPEEERRRYGTVLRQYYRYIDGEIGRAIERLGPDDLLLVVSPFGMEPLSLPKRLLERALGNHESGTHERAPDGFLMAFGSAVRPGRLRRGSVLDVAPTVLYYFGLPIGRDMDGYARTDLFVPPFTAARPLAFIPTHER